MADGLGSKVQIEFILNPRTGLVESMKPIGVVGASCQKLTGPFERRFGGEKTDVKLPEFYEQQPVAQKLTLGEGGGPAGF